MKALIDEWKHMISGKTVFILLLAPIIVSVVFGYVFKNNQINEAPVAIIDQDHSSYSSQLINKLDASQYVNVKSVYENNVDPNMLLYNEKYFAVIYLPSGMEANRMQGKQSNIGFYVDNTVSQATGNLRTGVTEVITAENATLAAGSLKASGLTDGQISGMTSNMVVQQRLLYNPTNSTMMSSVLGFVNTVMLSLIAGAALSIIPRLRVEGRLQEEMQNPMGILLRVLPYALVGCISFFLSIGLLKQVGGLRFEAGMLQMLIPFMLYTTTLSLFAMVIGWTAPNPDKASGRIMLLMMPSFLLSGAQLPVAMLPGPLQVVGHILPLTWHFKFLRGMGFRGGELRYFIPELGGILILMSVFAAIIFILMVIEKRKLSKMEAKEAEVPVPQQQTLAHS
ncbi:ABC transporter permease [Paenibacillus sp. P96]|uniref:ABC transporter permease n=1 Tax=Paenibacillus zeirhizosphaerae TaxID=2987519 RepID=A0ABT9FM83_9BACL|nr:ABC transporter permease [Paenibacillus sp. P96]MDP4095852.1 ABC transporter permease [Paenibacillus sp. P96]